MLIHDKLPNVFFKIAGSSIFRDTVITIKMHITFCQDVYIGKSKVDRQDIRHLCPSTFAVYKLVFFPSLTLHSRQGKYIQKLSQKIPWIFFAYVGLGFSHLKDFYGRKLLPLEFHPRGFLWRNQLC